MAKIKYELSEKLSDGLFEYAKKENLINIDNKDNIKELIEKLLSKSLEYSKISNEILDFLNLLFDFIEKTNKENKVEKTNELKSVLKDFYKKQVESC